VSSFHQRICDSLITGSKEPGMSSIFLKQCSRLVKFGASDDLDSVKDAFS